MSDYDKLKLIEEYSVDLAATAAVTAVLVFAAYGIAKLVEPKNGAERSGKAEHVDLLAEYGRAWCLHQFVPFVDKLVLGSYGQAMDNRMLKPWDQGPDDWMIRLPLLILSFLSPTPSVLLLAHIANIISWFYWMPAVWDHMVWAALLELTFVFAVLAEGGKEAVAKRFLPAARMQLSVLYWSAAFWKLTTSWYTVRGSCAPVLLSELMAGLFTPEIMPAGSQVANTLLKISPVFVAALEFAVAYCLTFRPAAG
ncbi:CHT1, partial [Symbiodinium pilosum]